jgi:hypothetical protein
VHGGRSCRIHDNGTVVAPSGVRTSVSSENGILDSFFHDEFQGKKMKGSSYLTEAENIEKHQPEMSFIPLSEAPF